MSEFSNPPKYYWDACAWLGLLNREPDKYAALKSVWEQGERGECTILTSALSRVEVFRKKCEKIDGKPLPLDKDIEILKMFDQEHVVTVQLDSLIAERARNLLREHTELKKAPDAIHLATGLFWDCDEMHTWDQKDLLCLNLKVSRRDGEPLKIIVPDEPSDGPLFDAAVESEGGQ